MSSPDHSARVDTFWTEFLLHSGLPTDTPLYDVFHFDNSERVANQLAELVMQGTKRATASLVWEYGEHKRIPAAGDFSIVTNWAGEPLCVIETTMVEITRFDDVSEEFAAVEGEGDGSLEHWRNVHERYFADVCKQLGREPAGDMEVVCERFDVVFRRPRRSTACSSA